MPSNNKAPVSLSGIRDRVTRRRALLQAAEAKPHAPHRNTGRAWIHGREIAPNPRLVHLSLVYD